MLEDARLRIAKTVRHLSANEISHLQAKALVAKALAGLLANDGVRPIGGRMESRIEKYAKERLGGVIYAPWLVFYATYRGAFHEGWIPDNFFQQVAIPRINGPFHMTDNARTLQRRLIGSDVIPDVAHFVSGEWRGPEGELWDRASVAARLFGNQAEICVKTEQSSKGRGVRLLDRESFRLEEVEALGPLVAQRVIRQSEALEAIFPGAVTTIRVTTAKLPGARPVMLFSNLRMGRGAARKVTLGSLKVPIVDGSGSVGPIASDSDWRQYRAHPDTGFRFEGATIPGFAQLRDDCLALHDRLPQFGLVGWDVTIDRDGHMQLLELNTGHPGIKFAEATVGPCLGALHLERYVRRPRRHAA